MSQLHPFFQAFQGGSVDVGEALGWDSPTKKFKVLVVTISILGGGGRIIRYILPESVSKASASTTRFLEILRQYEQRSISLENGEHISQDF